MKMNVIFWEREMRWKYGNENEIMEIEGNEISIIKSQIYLLEW